MTAPVLIFLKVELYKENFILLGSQRISSLSGDICACKYMLSYVILFYVILYFAYFITETIK